MRVNVRRKFRYAGRRVGPGERIDINPADYESLILRGLIETASIEPEVREPVVEKAVLPAPEQAKKPAKKPAKKVSENG